MSEETRQAFAWCRSYRLGEGEHGLWQLGPYQLWASRLATEWRLAVRQNGDSLAVTYVVEVPSAQAAEPPEGTTVYRFGFRQPPGKLELVPALADRPVVVSPEDPLLIPPREQSTLFISTPMWVQVVVGEPATTLLDQPSHRLTDTWFGATTMVGELCYASRTKARMSLAQLPVRPHRAISAVKVRNQAGTALHIEKLKLPSPQMSVYLSKLGHFWTDDLTLERQGESESATVSLDKGPPRQAPDAVLVGPPRTPPARGLLTRAFAGLLR